VPIAWRGQSVWRWPSSWLASCTCLDGVIAADG